MKTLIFILILISLVWTHTSKINYHKQNNDDRYGTATRIYFMITEAQAQDEKGIKEIEKVIIVKSAFEAWRQHRLSVDSTEALFEAYIVYKEYAANVVSFENRLDNLINRSIIQNWGYWNTYLRPGKKNIYDLVDDPNWISTSSIDGKLKGVNP